MQLKDVQRAYAKTGKNWHPIVKQAETLKTHVLLLERDAKKKALIMDKLKKKLAKNPNSAQMQIWRKSMLITVVNFNFVTKNFTMNLKLN